eukprot:8708343-Pyramimonas_sp.AAC.1
MAAPDTNVPAYPPGMATTVGEEEAVRRVTLSWYKPATVTLYHPLNRACGTIGGSRSAGTSRPGARGGVRNSGKSARNVNVRGSLPEFGGNPPL